MARSETCKPHTDSPRSDLHARRASTGVLGIALAATVLTGLFGGSAFAMQPLAQGYLLGAAHAGAEGKCGEGKCGSSKAGAKAAQAEGKCGEGKCGGSKAGGKAAQAEGKCGEGKCGDASFAKTDRSGDGRVSRAELLAVAPQRGADFAKIDRDRDGFISESEAYEFLKATYAANGKPMPAGLFAKQPANGR
ncbi:EF-hand domain-containing protein [Lysobacter sp. BMK333-48F3]|uniref:HvfA family oxazolone/thioamide-modified RiPP metallophore n=1 Tax=Lysobacter sp. BMK333-48F3 TaxID=2867962 RepID=UPI001C8B197A|nr:EF-hand domain-containing protein [Lysobacter sp. BMK333-48F3]MBX9402293.1 EF-hand domain-containing protein [Lysobacter sp. BMK333-48F3]